MFLSIMPYAGRLSTLLTASFLLAGLLLRVRAHTH
jgi:hypothetical protein